MTETTNIIRTAYTAGTVTAALHQSPDPASLPWSGDLADLPRLPMVGIDVMHDITPDPDGDGYEDERVFGFWLTPENPTRLAHRLLTLAHQAARCSSRLATWRVRSSRRSTEPASPPATSLIAAHSEPC